MATLRKMARLSKTGATHEGIRARARDLRSPQAIRRWLARRFEFESDPPGLELLKAPDVMLREWEDGGKFTGDCDDAAIMAAAVALAAGFRVRWVVVGFRPGGPFRHVYAEAWDGRRWVDFDVTRPAQFPAGLRIRRRLNVALR